MLIREGKLFGIEYAVEHTASASWKDWGVTSEGRGEGFLFLGKFMVVYTNHNVRNSKRGTVVGGWGPW